MAAASSPAVPGPGGEETLAPAGRPVDMPALLAAAGGAHGIEILGPPGLLS